MRIANTILIMVALVVLNALLHLSAVAQQFIQRGNKLVGSGAVGNAQQGRSVFLSADGNTAIVGGFADNTSVGAAWIYTLSGGVWTQQGNKLVGTGAVGIAGQGFSVSLSADGNTAIVGGWYDNLNAGAAWVYTRSGGVWTQQGNKLFGTGAVGVPLQGASVSLSADGNTAIVGGPSDNLGAGAAWVYTRSGGVWTQQGNKLVGVGAAGSTARGSSVSLSADGNTAIVGGYEDNNFAGAAWVYTRSGGVWTQQGSKLVGTGAVGNAQQGRSVSLSADGNTALVGGAGDNLNAGAAWVYTRSGGVWTQQGNKLVGTGAVGKAFQGWSVSVSADGNTAIVGGARDNLSAGAAWVYTQSGGVWTQQGTKFVGTGAVGNAEKGIFVSLSADGNTAIVGGWNDNIGAGAAWAFVRSNTYSYNLSKNNVNKSIFDNQNTFDTLTVFTASPLAGFVRDVNVQIDTIIHPNVGDLEISLLHLGVNDTIAYQVGGTGDNFIGTALDDSATTPIANGSAPFTGLFRPTRPLTQFNTLDVSGAWILRIFDRATGNTGTLRAWSLSIGVSAGPTSAGSVSLEVPERFQLMQNYPNPFNPSTKIGFSLPAGKAGVQVSGFATLKVYDVLGREVRTIVSEELKAGTYEKTFDATGLSSGVYFYTLQAGGFTETKRLLLLR